MCSEVRNKAVPSKQGIENSRCRWPEAFTKESIEQECAMEYCTADKSHFAQKPCCDVKSSEVSSVVPT